MKWRPLTTEKKAVINRSHATDAQYIKGMPGASMLAEVLLQKYEYHVPFYRQVKQLEHLGVKLSRNTLDGWFRPVCELLRPLYLELRKKVLAADYLQVDETTLPVINHERHKAAKEYIWIVRAAVPRSALLPLRQRIAFTKSCGQAFEKLQRISPK